MLISVNNSLSANKIYYTGKKYTQKDQTRNSPENEASGENIQNLRMPAEFELLKAHLLTIHPLLEYRDKSDKTNCCDVSKEICQDDNNAVIFDTSQTYLTPDNSLYDSINYLNIKDRAPNIAKLFTKTSKEYKFCLENSNLDLDSDVNLFDGFDIKTFDIPERFAVMADNSLRKNGSAYIIDDIAPIFQGEDIAQIAETLSKFARGHKFDDVYKFKAGNKEITAVYIGGGEVGEVYKLTDEFNNTVAIKIYSSLRGKSLDINSGLVEIALSRQLAKDNVTDVPKFYMANAGLYKRYGSSKICPDTPWLVFDYIDDDTKAKNTGIKLTHWLQNHYMHYGDSKNQRTKGGYLLDIGGCVSDNYKARKIWGIFGMGGNDSEYSLNSLLENSLKQGVGINEILGIFH